MPRVPIFPLNTVLFPGVVTPLHIFEDRYRSLVEDLLALPTPAERVFGAVAIREGYEVGDTSVRSAHRVGTLVQLTGAAAHEVGSNGEVVSYDIEVTGRERFLTLQTYDDEAYVTADVEVLDDQRESPAAAQAARALATFERYRGQLAGIGGAQVADGHLPRDPVYLSWTLAASCLLPLDRRQALLEAPTAADRLDLLDRSLRAEIRAMQAVPSLPATEVARTRWSPN